MTTDNLLPLGQKPEGELHALERMQNAFNKLMTSIKVLEENIKKLTEENKRLKEALGITETLEPLLLTEDMEVKEPSWKDLVKEESPLNDLKEVINGHK
jgi:regulator of replication initiation timing|tara:strand:- start:5223 stop:5519 length:297 start_codon:yes stop_codon:yes gene_type:complete